MSNAFLRWTKRSLSGLDGSTDEAGIDPYLVWLESTRFAICGAAPRVVPVLYERSASTDVQSNDETGAWIESLHRSNPLNGESSFGTAHVPLVALTRLTQAVSSGWLRRFELAMPRIPSEPESAAISLSPTSAPDGVASTMPGLAATGRCAVLGVVDDGCCLAHERFRPDNRTRFAYVWDQSRDDSPSSAWRTPAGTPYGAELSWREIDALLERHPQLGEVDERKFYAALGRPRWGSEGRRHGAGILHTLVDGDDQSSVPPRPIVFVQMPDSTVADTSGGSLGFHVVDGARYIVRRAKEIAQAARCARWSATVNLSVGSLSGPHDGTTIAEMALAEIAGEAGVDVVVAAGNGATWKTHAQATMTSEHPARFCVLASPDNPRETYVELWFPSFVTDERGALETLSVHVTTPAGVRSAAIGVGEAGDLRNGDNVVASVVFARRVAQGTRGTMALVALRATSTGAGVVVPPYGVWTIDLRTAAPMSISVHGWIQRNDIIFEPRLPQQASFVDDGGVVCTTMTLGSIANGSNTTVVGGYRLQDASVVDYSGQGPTREDGERKGPDYYGPSDESAFLPGLNVPGFYSGSRVRVSGTSIAAPRVARWLADERPRDEIVSIEDLAATPDRARAAPIVKV